MKTVLTGSGVVPVPIPATGVGVSDPGGLFGGNTNVQDILDYLAAGSLGAYLTVVLGGQGTVQALDTLGATETIDLANANYFWGTLDQACTISFTGFTNLKDCQIVVELIEDGTGGWTPTFSGVTWEGGTTPTHDTTAATVTRYVFTSRDGGTTIYGSQLGAGGLDLSLVTVAASGTTETINVATARTYDVTLTANCTFTFSGAVTGEAWFFTLVLRQDGTGSRLATWPGSVVWAGGAPVLSTAASSVDVFTFFTLDGGTVWFGFPTGGSSSLTVEDEGTPLATAATTLDFVGPLVTASGAGAEKTITVTGVLNDLTDVTITAAGSGDKLRYNGSAWVDSNLHDEPMVLYDGTVMLNGSGNPMMHEVAW